MPDSFNKIVCYDVVLCKIGFERVISMFSFNWGQIIAN